MCKDYLREKNDEDLFIKDEEDKIVEKDKVWMENFNSNVIYFVLCVDGNKIVY